MALKKCGYKWQTEVRNCVRGSGCTVCAGKRCGKGINDLAIALTTGKRII